MGGLAKRERAVPESVSVSGRVGEMRCVRPDEGSLPQRSLNPTSLSFFLKKTTFIHTPKVKNQPTASFFVPVPPLHPIKNKNEGKKHEHP